MKKLQKRLFYSNLIYFLLLSFFRLDAQVNLVPDGGFEDTNNIVSIYGHKRLKQWKNLDSSRPLNCEFVYYCYNNPIGGLSLPLNSDMYQHTHSGNGFININTYWIQYWVQFGQPPDPTVRGVPRSKLKRKLEFGKKYCVKSYVNADGAGDWYSNGFGLYFDNGQLDTIVAKDSSGQYYFVTPQVKAQQVLKDTQNWTLISGTFIADGKEEFVTIGNFLSDVATQKDSAKPGQVNQICNCATLNIDDVSVIPVDLANWLRDTTVKLNDSVYIGLPLYEVPDAIWYTANGTLIDTASGIWIKPTQAVTKYVQAIDVCDTIRYDTLTVYAYPASNNAFNYTTAKLNITPNPAQNNFIVTGIPSNTTTYLINPLGEIIQSQITTNNSAQFDVSALPKGIYFVRCGRQVARVLVE
jgi:hypothetical protein